MAPETIEHYQIQRELGKGGMASVYLAHDPRFGRDVAVKVLPREFMHDETFHKRFQQEARTIAQLEHPAIVPVHDFGEHEGQPYMVMRYMPGGSLADRLKQEGALPLEEVADILSNVAEALDAAHLRGIIHRDVKPANILFDQYGKAYLSDFGVVKLTESTAHLTGSGVVGTPIYMAPEMVNAGSLTPLIDVYALGVTLFQMLTGQVPYHADTPMGIFMAHTTKPIPNLQDHRPELPPVFQNVIDRSLAKEPAERHQSAGEISDHFERAISGADELPAREPTPDAAVPDTESVPEGFYEAKRAAGGVTSSPDATASVPQEKRGGLPGWLLLVGGIAIVGIVLVGLVIGGLVLAGVFAASSPPPTSTLPPTQPPPTQPPTQPPTETPSEPPTVTPQAAGTVLMQDDFSDPDSGWEIGDYQEGAVGYTDGQYFVLSSSTGSTMWGLAGQSFTDVEISIDATQVSAPSNDNNSYGVGCRIQNNDDGYYLRISGDGFYSISKVVEGEFQMLADWTESVHINLGNATNRLRVLCNGSTLELYVNDNLLASVTDSQFTSGDITLTATTFEDQATEVRFDNIVVSTP